MTPPLPQQTVLDADEATRGGGDSPLTSKYRQHAAGVLFCYLDASGDGGGNFRTEHVSASDVDEHASAARPDAILLDDAPEPNGCDARRLIRSLREQDRHVPILYRTSGDAGSLFRGLAALELGVNELISDAASAEELRQRITGAVLGRRLQKRPTVTGDSRPADAAEQVAGCGKFAFVAAFPPLVDTVSFAARAIRTRVPLLIHGEPGTGKSTLAGVLCGTAGATDDVRTVDCAVASAEALCEFLFASDGSDVDAGKDRRLETARPAADRFSTAGDVLLVIENVDLAPRTIQLRLSAVLRQTFRGAPPAIPRLIMTASKSLIDPGGRATGGLAEPLRFDLAGAMIELPPLRERGGDIDRLIDHFLCRATNTLPLDAVSLDPRVSGDARSVLREHSWPGNLGELAGVIRGELCRGGGVIPMSSRLREMGQGSTPRGKTLEPGSGETTGCPVFSADAQPPLVTNAPESNGPGSLQLSVLAAPAAWSDYVDLMFRDSQAGEESPTHFADAVQAAESGLIGAVLEKTGGNIAQSARLLGITRVSLRRKINSLGIRKAIE